jgi:hypothetical protein
MRVNGALVRLESQKLDAEQVRVMLVDLLDPVRGRCSRSTGRSTSATHSRRRPVPRQRLQDEARLRRRVSLHAQRRTLAARSWGCPSTSPTSAPTTRASCSSPGPRAAARRRRSPRSSTSSTSHGTRTCSPSKTRSSSCTSRRRRSSTSARLARTRRPTPSAMRGALREDPDIIVVGDMRDPETIRLALLASETGPPRGGHHADDRRRRHHRQAGRVLPRRRAAAGARGPLESLKLIVSQVLVPHAERAGPGRHLRGAHQHLVGAMRSFATARRCSWPARW